ncbi:lysophospholipid acyltransferase family protein [Geoalkalibacter halelectricus]|uniref:Lysophospholipid acyltransferase family protein n=1 Tax=Geoalkalibacter halelectricus TaxID=2847045 RepID=A0ABY5ZJJ9_9BACT|nr:lysophospholipid acyltransferase family protein [Geoalkalibacter halelectricus]MDO3379569.1 lysophospholipid acyltransferase family protein [Geoalkalibacter halelectricus]UWZ78157.1 lysophospholipid acyltransferase family protein [Geoalkalibacter halelectricus]
MSRESLPLSDRLLIAMVPWVASIIIRVLYRLMRIEILGEERVKAIWQKGEHFIFPFWHEQLLLMIKCYRGPGAKILISSSKDGELIARTMELFGQGTVRGSSSRGGAAALRSLVQAGKEPFDLGITPDGPRGPRREIKEGIVHLARLTGRGVVPLAFVCSRGYRFSSWDRFLLPYPFSRGVYSFGEPVLYQKGEDPEAFRARLQQAMDDNEKRAIARLEELGVSAV